MYVMLKCDKWRNITNYIINYIIVMCVLRIKGQFMFVVYSGSETTQIDLVVRPHPKTWKCYTCADWGISMLLYVQLRYVTSQ